MLKSIFKPGKKYTFSDYFKMSYRTQEIIAEFGYSFAWANLALPLAQKIDEAEIARLRSTYYALVAKVSLNTETAKRELIVAPLLHSVVRQVDAQLDVEYPLEIDDKLSGSIDYLFRAQPGLVVIEAKKGDLEQGFNQLAAEMVAVDKYEDPNALLYGAITVGETWRFAVLDRIRKHLDKDLSTYRFPEDLEMLFAILKGILTNS